jgi:hypothetical protein
MATEDSSENTYSVSFRLQRVTVEYAFVKVPVTSDLVVEHPDGTGRIDVPKMMERAVELGQSPSLAWHAEETQIQPHPIQKAPEPGEG